MTAKSKTKIMRGIVSLLLTAILVAAGLPLAAQEDEMMLPARDPAELQRPAVAFSHARHAEQLDCNRCHHDFDAWGNNTVEEDGQACADCHEASAGTNPVPLTRAYHLQCKGCHQDLNAAGQAKALPVMCGQCHVRQPRSAS